MRCLVAGGAGFIGSHWTDHLLNEGHEVLVLDNLITGRGRNLAHVAHHPKFEFQKLDVTLDIHVDGPIDFVFHFASPASPADFRRFPIQILKAGAMGTHKTLGLALAKGAKYMLASTSEVYGDPQIHPQPETYWGNVNPLGERGVYDEAKRYAEALTMAYHRMHGVDVRIARIFNTYGPRMRLDDGRLVPNFLAAALAGQPLPIHGDGSQTRSFGFISDLIRGLALLAESNFVEPINLGSDAEWSIAAVADLLEELLGKPLKREYLPALPDDPVRRRPDLTRAQQILGWRAEVPLPEGLARTLANLRGPTEHKP